MSSQLVIETTGHVAVLVAAIGIATCARALASVLRTWIEQASRTRRLNRALEGTNPSQRAGIIVACSQLEGTTARKPEPATAEREDGQAWQSALIPLNRSSRAVRKG
jgi:hypothetical protein